MELRLLKNYSKILDYFPKNLSKVLLMNISDMISNMSEETIISLAFFVGAGVIYVIRKFSFLNQQLREHEERELSGRDSVVRDLLRMNGIEDKIRLEYDTPKNHIENELVEHEMIGHNMAPRIRELSRQIADVLDDQSDGLVDVTTNVNSISSKINKAFTDTGDNSLEQINNMIPQLISRIEGLNESVKGESQKVAILLNEVQMIKRAIGVE